MLNAVSNSNATGYRPRTEQKRFHAVDKKIFNDVFVDSDGETQAKQQQIVGEGRNLVVP